MDKPIKIAFKRGNMVRNKTTGKLFLIIETPQRARIFVGDKPCYAIGPWIHRASDTPPPKDLSIVIYEQVTAESLFTLVL